MILVLFVFPPLFCIGERTRMCSLSIINTYESSILEKYFSKLSVISNAYISFIFRLSAWFLFAARTETRRKKRSRARKKRRLDRTRARTHSTKAENTLKHACHHRRPRPRNVAIIIITRCILRFEGRNLARTRKPSPLYPSPPRKFLAGGEETRAICATRRRRKPREKKKRNGFQAGTKGTRERFRCSEYANGLSWPFRWSARLG